MLVLRVSLRKMGNHLTNSIGIGTGRLHPLLRLAHFTGGHHLHGAGDFLGILNASDFIANLFTASHIDTRLPDLVRFEIFHGLFKSRFDFVIEDTRCDHQL
jgi:hypothetical protein